MSGTTSTTVTSSPPAANTGAAGGRGQTPGRELRRSVPRSSHAECVPPAKRADPIELLRAQEATRVPELVELRHQRMVESAFAFYRGAAIVMAADLAACPSTGLMVQACGDAHLANFGGFAAPDRAMVFDINDFDETTRGPFEWDVKRLAASLEIAARSREFDAPTARSIVVQAVEAYRTSMARYAGMTNLGVWYERFDATTTFDRWRGQISDRDGRRIDRSIAKAQAKDSSRALAKLTRLVDGRYQIVSDPPVLVPIAELTAGIGEDELDGWLRERLALYAKSLQPDRRHLFAGYELVDFARKVVGVGSVGTRCWIALLFGRDPQDPLVLQIKEAEASVLERYCGNSKYANHGQRVVEGQRLLQSSSDIFLGWLRTEGIDGVTRDFYVRQLWDSKLSADVDTMMPDLMGIYAQLCGATLARGHARSGDRFTIASYLGSGDVFDRAIADFASSYADQNQRDFETAKRQLTR